MIIHAYAEAAAPFGTTILQYATTAFALHTLAKAMYTQAAGTFGLICTLRHPIVLLKKPGHIALGILR